MISALQQLELVKKGINETNWREVFAIRGLNNLIRL